MLSSPTTSWRSIEARPELSASDCPKPMRCPVVVQRYLCSRPGPHTSRRGWSPASDLRSLIDFRSRKIIKAGAQELATVEWLCDTKALLREETRGAAGNTPCSNDFGSGEAGAVKPRTVTKSLAFLRPGWRNWQTQRTQNPPGFGPWGFDSPSRHQLQPITSLQ